MIEIIEQAIAAHNAAAIKRAETAEKQLVIAEKVLIEKAEQIAILKRALDKRDAKIKFLEEQLANQISTVIADAEKDKKIKELKESLSGVINHNEKLQTIHRADSARIAKLEQIIGEYTSIFKNIEGTLCAASDHFKEVSNFIHTIVK